MDKNFFFTLSLIILFSLPAFSQTSNPGSIRATKIVDPVHIDGNLAKAIWQNAIPVTNFRQSEPAEGAEPTELTKVAVLYDTHNNYFGVWCFDSQPDKLSAKQMNRDFEWGSDDDIEIMISPFNDNRNGYLFVTNPNGAMADSWLGGDGGHHNIDWNGVWNVRVSRDEKGWYAEFAIPFSTLKFKKEEFQT